MAVTLADLVARLQAAVPARDGVPGSSDYEQHVKDAVLQLSQDVPLRRTGTLNVVSGTASYGLPSDFLFLIELEGMASADGVLVSDSGLIPVSATWQERYDIDGSTITFDPTPTYTLIRDFCYGAVYELSGAVGSEQYDRLTQNGARIALLYAQHLALSQQANVVAGDGWRYQIGDEAVDKTRQGTGLREQAQALLDQYRRAVAQQKGFGSRAQYNVLGA